MLLGGDKHRLSGVSGYRGDSSAGPSERCHWPSNQPEFQPATGQATDIWPNFLLSRREEKKGSRKI